MDRFRILLAKGYFPVQLPPAFTTEQFARWRNALVSKLPNNWNIKPKESERFSQARTGHRRRSLAIAHPISQLMVANVISLNWQSIKKHQNKSGISVSKTKFVENEQRATALTRLSELRALRLRKSAGYRFVLKSDVLQYFPTIYTHAIPWAIHGKALAKKNKKNGPAELVGNNLDYWIRQGQSGQTMGIPIGPDSSHVISEILGAAIDQNIKASLKQWPDGYRHVDDFFFCFENSEDAAKCLAAIVKALDAFELQINPDKTAILPIENYIDEDWAHHLERMSISTKAIREQRLSIVEYFEKIFEIAKEYRDESVIGYALKKSANFVIYEENWELFQSYISKIAIVYPNNMETVCSVLTTYLRMGYSLDSEILSRVVNSTIIRHAPLNHHSEVAWALWLAKECQISLVREAVLRLTSVRSSVCAIITLDLERNGLLKSPMNKEYWRAQCSEAALHGVHWLFAYEMAMKGWISGVSYDYLSKDPFFNEMKKRKIIFYEERAMVSPLIVREKVENQLSVLSNKFDLVSGGYGYKVSEVAEQYID